MTRLESIHWPYYPIYSNRMLVFSVCPLFLFHALSLPAVQARKRGDMDRYRFSDATGYSLAHMTDMHNASFSGYFFPQTMTPQMTADFWRIHQIDANRSVVMHDQAGAFVGMARVGVRERRGWCGGFGIAPAFRGRGASKLLAAEMLRVARDSGLQTLHLEVLTQNERAFKVYKGAGFVTTRLLFGLQMPVEQLPAGANIQTQVGPPELLLPWRAGTERPVWGRELPSLLTLETEAILIADPDGRVNGLLVRRLGARLLVQAAVLQPDLPVDRLVALLRHAAGNATMIQVYNEPEGSDFLACCRALSFEEFFSQYEMYASL
jgi:ribosomal protein S18 acetylase RimI-like enzyme